MSVGADLVLGAGCFAISLLSTPVVAGMARRVGLVDHPGHLKPHARATPYLGGVSVGAAVVLGAAWFRPLLLVPLGMALGLGTVDDVRPLPPLFRLAAEIATGVTVASLVSTRFSSPLSYIFVTVSTVALINAFNLLDGLDALCGSVSVLSAAGFAVILTDGMQFLAVALCAAVAGFLVFNLPPAKIYLGDGGSYLIGAGVAVLLAAAWRPSEELNTGLAALALVTLPLAELGCAALRRFRSRRSLLLGDRNHPYDQLIRRGWSSERAVASYALVALILVGVAALASLVRTPVAAVVTGAAIVGIVVLAVEAGFTAPEAAEPTGYFQP